MTTPYERVLDDLAATLRGPRRARQRLLDEIAEDLKDAGVAERAAGLSRDAAEALVAARFGNPTAIANQWNGDQAQRRRSIQRNALVLVTAMAMAGALGITQYASGTNSPTFRQQSDAASVVQGLGPVQFVPAVGWDVRSGSVHACPGVSASRCSSVTSTASTTRWLDCLHCLPHRTVAAMSPGDIGLQVTIVTEHPKRIRRTFGWPPRLSRRNVHAGFEGLPGRIGVYQGSTRIGAREAFVVIVFGRARPTDRQLQRTNEELRRARLG